MNNRDWMGFSRTAMAVAVAVVAAAPAMAQNTTAAIGGQVTGADGNPVAGATVSILHVESGSSNTVTTDASGRYGARGLRPGGPYTITISKGGQTDKREGVFLTLAETGTLNAQLGASAQTIVVTGRGVSDQFNKSAMGAGTNIGSRELAALASVQRNLADYARTDPRLAQTDKERGEISAGGQNTRFNSITIDGVTVSDTFGLESNGLPTAKQPISIDAIQSVQVNLSNYDVTQKGYTGANINAVTKSGTNEFKGSVYYVWRDDGLVGKRFNRSNQTYFDAPAFEESTKGFTLGGPIIKDKLFFFASYEELASSRTSPDFGPLGSSTVNVGISQAAIDSAIAIGTAKGMNVGSSTVPSGVELSVKDTLLKLDWNISDNHRANLRYTKTEQTEPFLVGFSATGLALSSWMYNQDKTLESVVGQWFADWTPNFSTEVKVSKRDYASAPTPLNGSKLPAIGLSFNGVLPTGTTGVSTNTRFLNMGTELSRHFNVLETETTDLYFGGNLVMGAHELKFGLDYQKNDVFNAFLQNTNGNYTFRCENTRAATQTQTAITYAFNNGAALNCATASIADNEAAALENFNNGTPSSYTVQLPRAGRTLADGAATWSYANTGLMLQDIWAVNQALSLTLGLRVDQQSVPTKPLFNAGAAAAQVAGTIAGTTYTRASGGFGIDNTVTLDGNNLVQPRVGFNWNPGLERRSQLRGGFGLFQGAAANVWLSNPFSNTGAATAQFNCANFDACKAAGAVFSPNPATQPALTGTPPAAAVDALSPGLEQPSVWKANLAFESELPPLAVVGTLVASVEWLHTKTDSGIYYQHLNLGAPTRLGSDGRELYYRSEGQNRDCWTAGGAALTALIPAAGTTAAIDCRTPSGQSRNRALSNPNFANVILAKETSKGYGDAITFALSRPVSNGLGFGVSYTRTVAKEVSPLTSSTSNSNWNGRMIFNPNEETLQNSNYLTKDRFTANVTYSQAFFGKYRTTVGAFWEGRSGKPYSWTYINDLNGDGITGNDLMYIPSAPGSGEVSFRGGAAEEARFWAIVNANPALAAAKGGVVGRNNSFAPFINTVDLRFSQELPGFMKDHKATFVLDVLNFGNLLNKKWGRTSEIGFPSNRSFVNYTGLDSNGKYVYSLGTTEDLVTRQASGESQWAVQATLRYEF
ncbi:MAG: TonB-dependent receptor [Rubrivivax sp.]|nr:TonB-dependent receptor [Rubrivivax sp.]